MFRHHCISLLHANNSLETDYTYKWFQSLYCNFHFLFVSLRTDEASIDAPKVTYIEN